MFFNFFVCLFVQLFHSRPAVEEEAGSEEGSAAAKRQLSARAGEEGHDQADNIDARFVGHQRITPGFVAGGHCEKAEAKDTASSCCSSEESLPELPAGEHQQQHHCQHQHGPEQHCQQHLAG